MKTVSSLKDERMVQVPCLVSDRVSRLVEPGESTSFQKRGKQTIPTKLRKSHWHQTSHWQRSQSPFQKWVKLAGWAHILPSLSVKRWDNCLQLWMTYTAKHSNLWKEMKTILDMSDSWFTIQQPSQKELFSNSIKIKNKSKK